jgi:hypothetical protein
VPHENRRSVAADGMADGLRRADLRATRGLELMFYRGVLC